MSSNPNLVHPEEKNGEAGKDHVRLLRDKVANGDLNEVCSMLYYGINVLEPISVKHPFRYGCDPLATAVRLNNVEIVTILINFYDDLYFKQARSEFGNRGCCLLSSCLHCKDHATLFKLLWFRINHDDLDDKELTRLLLKALFCPINGYNKLVATDWLECVYLILKGFNASGLLFCEPQIMESFKKFYKHLFTAFSIKNVQREDRLRITNICLSLGIPATWTDYRCVYKIYGFGDELEAIIYGNNFTEGLKHLRNNKRILGLPEFRNLKSRPLIGYLHGLRICYLSVETKQRYKAEFDNQDVENREEIFKMLDEIPEFPTLFELCRNQIRNSIYQSVKYPYQFHDAVKELNLSQNIRDVIRLKTGLYY